MNKEKLKENSVGTSDWCKKAEHRIKNEWWIKYKDKIYLRYLILKRKLYD